MKVILIFGDTLSSYCPIHWLDLVLLEYIFSLNYKCGSVSSGQLALILVKNRICKNELIDVKNTKISKKHYVKKTSFQSIPTSFIQKKK